jgi:hypothetical protein
MLLGFVPRWLKAGVGGALLYAFGLTTDLMGDAAAEAVKSKFPGYEREDSLNEIGKDRRIRRGPNEAASTYAKRLPQWLLDHKTRGGPYALLKQIHAYYISNPFAVALVYNGGRTFAMDVVGNVTMSDNALFVAPDGGTDWCRWWLFYSWPGAVNSDGNWGDPGTWGDGGIWDSDVTIEERNDIIQVPSEWKAAHAKGFVVLLNGGQAVMEVP